MTIDELFEQQNKQDGKCPKWAKDLAITFAQYHAKEATLSANRCMRSFGIGDSNDILHWTMVDEGTILKSYPLSNIK